MNSKMKIKALILDIDGVLVGEQKGYNSPDPHPDVVNALIRIKEKQIPITLCTAKPHFAISSIVEEASLDNPHITDGGGVIINPIKKEIIQSNLLKKSSALKVLDFFIKADFYVEFYTIDSYFSQKNFDQEIRKAHAYVLQHEAELVNLLVNEIEKYDVTKIMIVAKNENEK